MRFFRYNLPVDPRRIESDFVYILGKFGIKLTQDATDNLFSALNNMGTDGAGEGEDPFPLLSALPVVAKHSKLLKGFLGDKSLSRSHIIIAMFYGFSSRDDLTQAIETFVNGEESPFRPFSMLSPPYIDNRMLDDFAMCGDCPLPLDSYHLVKDLREARQTSAIEEFGVTRGLPVPQWSYCGDHKGEPRFLKLLDEIFYIDLPDWELFLIGLSPDRGRTAPKAYLQNGVENTREYDEYYQKFAALIKDPTPERLAEWPAFEKIPNVTRIIRSGVASRKVDFLKEVADADHPRIMLYGKQTVFEDGAESIDIDIWIALSHALEDFPFETIDSQHWNYTAHFLLSEPKPGQNPICAIFKGHYLTPFKGDRCGTEENFYYMMDAESGEFSKIASVILREVLPQAGFSGLFDFYSSMDIDSGILIPFPEIHPSFRGKGLLVPLMEMLIDVISETPYSVVVDAVEDPSCFNREEYEDSELQDEYGNPELPTWLGTPFALLLPTPGSINPFDYTVEGDPTEGKRDGLLAEQKQKLLEYYRTQVFSAEVYFFDPWEPA